MTIEYRDFRYHGFYKGVHVVNDSRIKLLETLCSMIRFKKVYIELFSGYEMENNILKIRKHSEFGEVALSINK